VVLPKSGPVIGPLADPPAVRARVDPADAGFFDVNVPVPRLRRFPPPPSASNPPANLPELMNFPGKMPIVGTTHDPILSATGSTPRCCRSLPRAALCGPGSLATNTRDEFYVSNLTWPPAIPTSTCSLVTLGLGHITKVASTMRINNGTVFARTPPPRSCTAEKSSPKAQLGRPHTVRGAHPGQPEPPRLRPLADSPVGRLFRWDPAAWTKWSPSNGTSRAFFPPARPSHHQTRPIWWGSRIRSRSSIPPLLRR